MEWLIENWFWVLFGLFFIWMHFSGHCGGHAGNKKDETSKKKLNHRD